MFQRVPGWLCCLLCTPRDRLQEPPADPLQMQMGNVGGNVGYLNPAYAGMRANTHALHPMGFACQNQNHSA